MLGLLPQQAEDPEPELSTPAEPQPSPPQGQPPSSEQPAPAQAPPAQTLPAGPRPAAAQAPPAATEPKPATAGADPGRQGPRVSHEPGMNLEELLNIDLQVWSATKTATSAQDAAAVVTVVTGEDIRRWGHRSLADVLQRTLGFYVIDDFILPNAGVRGISAGLWGESSAIKVMIDGHAVPFRATAGNWLGPELIPMTAVDYIEIIRGPASVLYGADALLGVINVVTRRGQQGADLHAGASYDNASRPGFDQDLSVGTRLGDFEVFGALRLNRRVRGGLSLPRSAPAAVFPSYRDPNTRQLAEMEHNSQVGYARLGYVTPTFQVSMSGWASALDRPGELSPWLQLADGLDPSGREIKNRIGLAQQHLALHLGWTASETFSLSFDGLAFRGGPSSHDRAEVKSDFFYVRRRFGFVGTDLNLEAQWRPFKSLTAVVGGGLIYDRESLLSILHVAKENLGAVRAGQVIESSSTRQGSKDFRNGAAYAQAILSPFDRYLSLIGGVRFDHHNIYGGQLSARAGAVSEPIENIHLKVLYGSAFKAPSPLLLYGVPLQPGDIIGNQDLEAQRVRTVELELAFRPIRQLYLRSDVAGSRLDNKAEFTQSGPNIVARNLAELEVLSWESSVEMKLDWLAVYASYEIQRSVRNFGQDGYVARLVDPGATNYPDHIARFGLELAPFKYLRLSGQLAYVGPRPASDANAVARGHAYELPPYLTVDAGLSLVEIGLFPSGPLEISVYGNNLTDYNATDPGFVSVDYPLARRSFVFEARQVF